MKIGFISSKKTNQVFILPNDLKILNDSKFTINIVKNYAKGLNIDDEQFKQNNTVFYKNNYDVIKNSDVVFKIKQFNKKECELLKNKIAITLSNFCEHVKMIQYMLKNNVSGLSWSKLNDGKTFYIFNELEQIKNNYVLDLISKSSQYKIIKPKKNQNPSLKNDCFMIVNLTQASIELIKKLAIEKKEFVFLESLELFYNYDKEINKLKEFLDKNKVKYTFASNQYEDVEKFINKCNYFIMYLERPEIKNKKYFFKTMLKKFCSNSILIDTGAENNFAIDFAKDKHSSKNKIFIRHGNILIANEKDICNLYANEASKIISKNISQSLLKLNSIKEYIDSSIFKNIIIIKDGQIIDSYTKLKLHLY